MNQQRHNKGTTEQVQLKPQLLKNYKLKHSLNGIMISVFLLHIIIILNSLDKGVLVPLLSNKLPLSELGIYLVQFAAACWTGFIIPLCAPLASDEAPRYHLRVGINSVLVFTVYYLWCIIYFGIFTSPLSVIGLFVIFLCCDYWIIYGLQYISLKQNVHALNLEIESIERDKADFNQIESAFMRREDYELVKRLP
ncbi:MAG: hypothetical protein BGO41_00915 [Clostridiales bacterium 38-18]|nr:MAG: hypothetical protein BGO41_00915 [Clostridiales bacterium 38-18]